MILDALASAGRYGELNPAFRPAFDFLRRPDLTALPDGRRELDDEGLYALISRGQGRGQAASPLEAHRQYIDIQFTLAGAELIGWRPTKLCRPDERGYDARRDIVFFTDRPDAWVAVPAGCFAIFWPEDAHAPLAGEGDIHKVVVKVAV